MGTRVGGENGLSGRQVREGCELGDCPTFGWSQVTTDKGRPGAVAPMRDKHSHLGKGSLNLGWENSYPEAAVTLRHPSLRNCLSITGRAQVVRLSGRVSLCSRSKQLRLAPCDRLQGQPGWAGQGYLSPGSPFLSVVVLLTHALQLFWEPTTTRLQCSPKLQAAKGTPSSTAFKMLGALWLHVCCCHHVCTH